jgi:predicted ATPase
MQISQITFENWKNFRRISFDLPRRLFVIGPNAAGKSNLLDGLRFLRDIANPEGGFQRAIRARGGVSQIRCLHARKQPLVGLDVRLEIDGEVWRYKLEFKQDKQRRPLVECEEVWRANRKLLDRPTKDDKADPSRLTQTHLEQVVANKEFRPVAESLSGIRYQHVVPQLIREPDRFVSREEDPFGGDFLDRVAQTNKRVLASRLKKINEALTVAVPQLKELKLEPDDRGVPHLKGLYEHWRPNAGWQSEDQFSDGTLRLFGLMWSLLDGNKPLLLEEPELSLHSAVVRYVPIMMQRIARTNQRQVVVSTHSSELLSDEGISTDEVLILIPGSDGTTARLASTFREVRDLVEGGLPVGDATLALAAPERASQLALF